MSRVYGVGATPRFNNIAEAAQNQQSEMVMEMLSAGYDINGQDMDGNTAVHWAALLKLDGLLNQLFDRGAKPDVPNVHKEFPVHWAAKSSNLVAVKATTSKDSSLLSSRDTDGFTPFLVCAQIDDSPMMEWMYLKGLSVDVQDAQGRTALHWACYKGHRRTVQWLLSRGANVAHRDSDGMTSLHWAAVRGHDQVSEMLIDVGAVRVLSTEDYSGDTPLRLASKKRKWYLWASFQKSIILQRLIGRPYLSRNYFANLFVAFCAYNVFVFLLVIVPRLWAEEKFALFAWSAAIALTSGLWLKAFVSDPGWLCKRTILPQGSAIEQYELELEQRQGPLESIVKAALDIELLALPPSADANGTEASSADEEKPPPVESLEHLETQQKRLDRQRQLIAEARRRLDEKVNSNLCFGVGAGNSLGQKTELQPLMAGLEVTPDVASRSHREQLDKAVAQLNEGAKKAAEELGQARLRDMIEQVGSDYPSMIERGDFKQVCVVCRTLRTMRSHHCKECGRCVQRLDHHCPWIDNCVGEGNQRLFYCFIVVLLLTTMLLYYVGVLYGTVAYEWWRVVEIGSWSRLESRLIPELCLNLLVLVTLCFDLIWIVFVGALFLRHTTYILVNLTTYEVLVHPPHVQRRFPKRVSKFWFLGDIGCARSWHNCQAYWKLDSSRDNQDFGVLPEHELMRPGSSDLKKSGDGVCVPQCPGEHGYAKLGPGRPQGPPERGATVLNPADQSPASQGPQFPRHPAGELVSVPPSVWQGPRATSGPTPILPMTPSGPGGQRPCLVPTPGFPPSTLSSPHMVREDEVSTPPLAANLASDSEGKQTPKEYQ